MRGRKNLAVARALWQARESFAQFEDTAPGRLLPDRSIIAAVRAEPESRQALAGIKEFTGRASRSQLPRWWSAIQAGRASTDLPPERVSSDALPPPRAWVDRNPAADARLKAAKPVIEATATAMAMPTENLLSPELLRRTSWAPPATVDAASIGEALATLGARPWQIDATSQPIADAFVASLQAPAETEEDAS